MRKNTGFTLIEIMVAVTIMIIISGLSLMSFIFSQRKSRDAKRKSDLYQVARSLEVFNEDFGRYPLGSGGNIVGCQSSAGSPLEACDWGGVFSGYPNGSYQLYMSELPDDPKGSIDYYYESDGTDINLYSVLENEKDKDYRTDLTQDCGAVKCNYLLTEYGSEAE